MRTKLISKKISMKKIVLIVLVFGIVKAYGQQGTDYGNSRTTSSYPANRTGNYPTNRSNNAPTNRTNNYNTTRVTDDNNTQQIRIVDTAQEINAEMLPFKADPKIKNDRYYFWYYNNVIHSTQGGYTGQLLNGHYIAFYPDKNLKEEGYFKRGLKDGEWKTWNQKGDLTNVTDWNEGVAVPEGGQPFWKKIPLLNKKEQQPQNSDPNGNQ